MKKQSAQKAPETPKQKTAKVKLSVSALKALELDELTTVVGGLMMAA